MSITVENGGPRVSLDEVTLFPFDRFSIPLQDALQLNLVQAKKQAPVVRRGDSGAHDSRCVRFDGSVIMAEGQLKMYYVGVGPDTHVNPGRPAIPGFLQGRLSYATSQDGFEWEKPVLGLVEYNGSKQNNIVDFRPTQRNDHEHVSVIYDPDDSGHPYKLIFCPGGYRGSGIAYSQDGIRWEESPENPVLDAIHGGLMKFNGDYYASAQVGNKLGGPGRKMHTFVSPDMVRWTTASAGSLRRDILRTPNFTPGRHSSHRGEQVHYGAGLWNRGNVILGFYGMWHGADNNDRRYIHVDIGLIVSHDALNYDEPIADFPIIGGGEQPDGASPQVLQGQGAFNVGDYTLTWYDALIEGDVRVASWARDRLGYFAFPTAIKPDTSAPRYEGPHFISCPMRVDAPGARVFVNADGLSEQSHLTVEILDGEFRPIRGYSEDECVPITEGGLRQQVGWRNKQTLDKSDHPVRVRVNYRGPGLNDLKVYAVYVTA
jgi:hypothetical protein